MKKLDQYLYGLQKQSEPNYNDGFPSKDIETLIAIVRELKGAVEFYGDQDVWEQRQIENDEDGWLETIEGIIPEQDCQVLNNWACGGRRARQALVKVDGILGGET